MQSVEEASEAAESALLHQADMYESRAIEEAEEECEEDTCRTRGGYGSALRAPDSMPKTRTRKR